MPAPPGASTALQPHAPGPSIVPPQAPARGRAVIWGIALTAAALAAAGVFYWNSQSAARRAPVVIIPTVTAMPGNIDFTVRVSGSVVARNYATLLAPRIIGSRSGLNRGGYVSYGNDFVLTLLHLAEAGARVKKGDVVGQFDPQYQKLRYDDYKDSVIQLEHSTVKLVTNLAANMEAHDQTVRSAKADWDKALLDLQTAPIRSQIDAEKYKLMVEQTEAIYKQLVYESSLVEESQRAAIRISELNREHSKIELDRAESNVRRMSVQTPIDGEVVMASIVRNGEYGQIREGDQVNAGQPFVTIVDPSSMVLNASVNQVDAGKLRLGMKATVRLDAYPGVELPATLIGIGAMSRTSVFRASFVGAIPVRIRIEKTDPRLIPDLTGSAEIVLASERDALVVPRSAIFEEAGEPFVYVATAQGWARRKVDLGLASFTAAAVRAGLEKGDKVALQRPL